MLYLIGSFIYLIPLMECSDTSYMKHSTPFSDERNSERPSDVKKRPRAKKIHVYPARRSTGMMGEKKCVSSDAGSMNVIVTED
jgi:hypothetical protein